MSTDRRAPAPAGLLVRPGVLLRGRTTPVPPARPRRVRSCSTGPTDGTAVALEDRCAHRAYPLSAGTLDGDLVRCGLCGFAYDTDGQCVSVPTQPRVPFGAHVAAYPVQERDGLVWVWLGESGSRAPAPGARAAVARPTTAGPASAAPSEVAAGFLLLHENFADVTQVPFVAPEIAPAALAGSTPPLEVVVTETTVELRREFPPAPLPGWQARDARRRGR